MKHVIRDYDQVLIRLTQLTQDYSTASRDYKFAVGDLFNEVVPAGVASPKFVDTMGMRGSKFQQYICHETDQLLEESGAGEYISRGLLGQIRSTARAWEKAERTFDVSFEVYRLLMGHKDLICDGMKCTEARRVVTEANQDAGAPRRRPVFNQTRRLTIAANQLAGQLDAFSEGHKEMGEPFSNEDVAQVREMYRALDEFVTENSIEHIWDLSETLDELVAA